MRDGSTVLTRNRTQCVADVRYVSSVVTAIACGSAVLPGAAPWCIEPNRPTDALHPTFTVVILHPPSTRAISTHTTSTRACCPSFKFPATTGKCRQHPSIRTCPTGRLVDCRLSILKIAHPQLFPHPPDITDTCLSRKFWTSRFSESASTRKLFCTRAPFHIHFACIEL